MNYLCYTIGTTNPDNTVTTMLGGNPFLVPLVEFMSNPVVPVTKLAGKSEAQRGALLHAAIRRGQWSVANQLRRAAWELEQQEGCTHLTLLPTTSMVMCLSADESGEDGEVEKVGWVFVTRIGLYGSDVLPDRFAPEDVLTTFPFWMVEPHIPPDPSAYLLTAQGRLKLARQLGVCLGYGPAPHGAEVPDIQE